MKQSDKDNKLRTSLSAAEVFWMALMPVSLASSAWVTFLTMGLRLWVNPLPAGLTPRTVRMTRSAPETDFRPTPSSAHLGLARRSGSILSSREVGHQ